jgi:hypothetical protein
MAFEAHEHECAPHPAAFNAPRCQSQPWLIKNVPRHLLLILWRGVLACWRGGEVAWWYGGPALRWYGVVTWWCGNWAWGGGAMIRRRLVMRWLGGTMGVCDVVGWWCVWQCGTMVWAAYETVVLATSRGGSAWRCAMKRHQAQSLLRECVARPR